MRESVRRAQVKKRESAQKRVNRGHGQRVVPKELRFRTQRRRYGRRARNATQEKDSKEKQSINAGICEAYAGKKEGIRIKKGKSRRRGATSSSEGTTI